jgi:diguanylate cyclase (GGDEF)-like protein
MTKDDILLVDDDPCSIQLMGRILWDVGSLRFATNGEDALRLARESAPDLMLLDIEMPGVNGFGICEAFKADPALADTPVIFVTSHSEPAFEVSGFELGAADFIAKPISASLLLARVKTQLRVKHMADELRRIATIDILTGVANRRRFDESLEREWSRGRRSNDPLALLMIDVDHFKLFNDSYGHPAGDACLRSVAQALVGTSLRPADLVARYGGEEFVVLLPQTPRGGAEHVAQGVLDAVDALGIAHEASLTARHVTVSVGIGCYDEDSGCCVPPSAGSRFAEDLRARCSPLDLVQAADKALYAAKQAGRAQARLLDLANVDTPQLARDIGPPSPQTARHRVG